MMDLLTDEIAQQEKTGFHGNTEPVSPSDGISTFNNNLDNLIVIFCVSDHSFDSFQMDGVNSFESNQQPETNKESFTIAGQEWSECAPPCTHQFCSDSPRAICSAKNILRSVKNSN